MKKCFFKDGAYCFLVALLASSILFPASSVFALTLPVTVGQSMPDFSLASLKGKQVSLEELKGKNILMIFPRVMAGKNRYCSVDNYRYAELIEKEKLNHIREKYNMEILYIFPFDKQKVNIWLEKNPEQLDNIKKWKTPPKDKKLTEGKKKSLERLKRIFPKDFHMEKGRVPALFPILIDEKADLCKKLKIFSTDWAGSKVDQCMPSVFIVDTNGILQFKYIGQDPFDRPDFNYLIKIIESMPFN